VNFITLVQIRETVEALIGDSNYFGCGRNGTGSYICRDNIKERSLLKFRMTSYGAGMKSEDE
jgi:hypothetical protein